MTLRDHLVAFVRAAAAKQDGTNRDDNGGEAFRRFQFAIGDAGGTGATLHFGYGYFSGGNVLYYGPADGERGDGERGEIAELSVEEGVDRWLKNYDLDR